MNNWIAFRTIVQKESLRVVRIWIQTLVPPAITMALYFVIFGNLIGSRVGTMQGLPYMDFIVPGVIMMAVINNAYGNVVSSFFGAKFQHHIEELLVAPVRTSVIIWGYVAGGVVRGLLVGLIVTGVSLFFTQVAVQNPLITLSVVVLTSVLFSLGGLINAIFSQKFDDISIIPTFVLTPLTYLGGVFYSIDLLPEFWQTVSLANPVLYMVDAFRYGIHGVSDIPIAVAYSLIIGFTLALYGLAWWLLERGVGIRQ